MDKDFVAATIQAIGRCATHIGEVRDTCLNGLVQLLSNRDGPYPAQPCTIPLSVLTSLPLFHTCIARSQVVMEPGLLLESGMPSWLTH